MKSETNDKSGIELTCIKKYSCKFVEVATKLFGLGICGADLQPKNFLNKIIRAGGPSHVSGNLFTTSARIYAARHLTLKFQKVDK